VSLLWEHFDLLMRQSDYFRAPLQALLHLLQSERMRVRSADLTGYDVTPAGQIRFAP
jgi:putative molybdopterin biosynthesis protein